MSLWGSVDPTEGPWLGWHCYRCPVCGHMDEVELGREPSRAVACSHCTTVLDVAARSAQEAAAVATVAKWRLPGWWGAERRTHPR
jgi:hypothetical protein